MISENMIINNEKDVTIGEDDVLSISPKDLIVNNNIYDTDDGIILSDEDDPGNNSIINNHIINVGGIIYDICNDFYNKIISSVYFLEYDDKIVFIDKDPTIFKIINDIIDKIGIPNIQKFIESNPKMFDNKIILSDLADYGLIDKKYEPLPDAIINYKKKIKKSSDKIINLHIGTDTITTLKSTLSKSHMLDKIEDDTDIEGMSYADVKYMLLVLRTKKIYFKNIFDNKYDEINKNMCNNIIRFKIKDIEFLNQEVEKYFRKIVNNKNNNVNNIVPMYSKMNNGKHIEFQSNIITESVNPLVNRNNDFIHKLPSDPLNSLVIDTGIKSNLTIFSSSHLKFGSQIEFNLSELPSINIITDIVIRLDIPVIPKNKFYKYSTGNETKIVKNVSVILESDDFKQRIDYISIPGEYIKYYPDIFIDKNIRCGYSELSKGFDRESTMIYKCKNEEKLINLHRILIPTFFLGNGPNSLNIPAIKKHNFNVKLVIDISPIEDFIEGNIPHNLPLLNAWLMLTGIKIPEKISPFKKIDTLYLYNKIIKQNIKIVPLNNNDNYDILTVSTKGIKFMKDISIIFFDSNGRENIDQLIQFNVKSLSDPNEIYVSIGPDDIKYLSLASKINPEPHIIYYSFANDPITPTISGGFFPCDSIIELLIKKNNKSALVLIREYSKNFV